MLTVLAPDNNNLYRILYLVHLVAAFAAFGPLFLYPRLQRAGETAAVAALHMRLVFPALVVMWIAGMGLAGVGKISLGGTWWVTVTIVLWVVALGVSWFLIKPALDDPSESNRAKLAAGVGITHLVLIVALYLMIFKPGGYEFT